MKSACVCCPYSGNERLRWIRDTDPGEWEQLLAFDDAIRHGSPHANAEGKPLRGEFYIHRSLLPLTEVDLDTTGTRRAEEDDPDGCSPFSCRTGVPATP